AAGSVRPAQVEADCRSFTEIESGLGANATKKSRSASHGTALISPRRTYPAQASKDFPQPQLWRALGLAILSPPALSSSLKSITDPRRYVALKGSTKTATPWNSAEKSPSRLSSNTMPYCIPEQPPFSMNTRRALPGLAFSLARSVLMWLAALSVRLTTTLFSATASIFRSMFSQKLSERRTRVKRGETGRNAKHQAPNTRKVPNHTLQG